MLPSRFTMAELDAALAELAGQQVTRGDSAALADRVRWMAASSYAVEFDEHSALSERVLWPASPAESHGMEDARFVRFTDGDDVIYYATYTAFDGSQVAPHLLETTDFRTFTVSQLSGPSARNKGMALFPRRIAGRYAALSRWDRESNAIGYSADGHRWSEAVTVQTPTRPWELIQLGNCGSPIETPAGWLVFTHGVGPMREYAIGAILLDLDRARSPDRRATRAAPGRRRIGARRLRPERRLLLWRDAPRRHSRAALRLQRLVRADRHGRPRPAARTAHARLSVPPGNRRMRRARSIGMR